ncbi:MAG: WS/DGAT/MGAT family O-acyltransferase [Acidimicrobiales bacterium]
MEQLNGLDASFLNIETSTVHGHVGSLAVFDASDTPMTLDSLKDLVTERLHELGPFRRRLVTVPFGLDRPYWIEDGEFDLDFHVRHIAVPPPGDDAQLAELIGRLHSRPLDRSRPLWELYLIEGLEGGLVAHYTKIHHACVDGVTGTEVLTTLLDTDVGGRDARSEAVPWSPDRVPNTFEMLGRGVAALATQPRVQARMQRRMLAASLQTGRRQAAPTMATMQEAMRRTPGIGIFVPEPKRSDDFLSRPALTAPRLSFNRSISAHRRFAFGSISLEHAKEIKERYDVTVNDVIMAITAGALRTWLEDRHELPTDPVLAMVPVSVRTEEDAATAGNRISAMVAPLPTNEANPLVRLRSAQKAMELAKTDHAALPADMLQDFGQFAPPAVAARVARLVARTKLADMANPPFNVVVSNIPGPQHALYCSGARQVASFPLPVITDGAALNITLASYDGAINFGLVACRDAIGDLWSLMSGLQTATLELLESSRTDSPETMETR